MKSLFVGIIFVLLTIGLADADLVTSLIVDDRSEFADMIGSNILAEGILRAGDGTGPSVELRAGNDEVDNLVIQRNQEYTILIDYSPSGLEIEIDDLDVSVNPVGLGANVLAMSLENNGIFVSELSVTGRVGNEEVSLIANSRGDFQGTLIPFDDQINGSVVFEYDGFGVAAGDEYRLQFSVLEIQAPEPNTFALVVIGLLAWRFYRRRK